MLNHTLAVAAEIRLTTAHLRQRTQLSLHRLAQTVAVDTELAVNEAQHIVALFLDAPVEVLWLHSLLPCSLRLAHSLLQSLTCFDCKFV